MIPRFASPSDAQTITAICSHPEVRRWTAQDGSPEFDVTRWLDSNNMVVLVDGGCFLLNWLGDTTWGVHTNFLPGFRGKAALHAAHMALLLVFLYSNAETLVTMVPEDNKAAAWFTRVMGFGWRFRQEGRWVKGGERYAIDHYQMTVDDWILQGHMEAAGQAFHADLEAQGFHTNHLKDPVHDSYVGAAASMVLASRVAKGIKLYNRWARAAGYVPIKVVSGSPLTLNLRDFNIIVEAGSFRFEAKEKEHA